jgi:hypothetical protein
VYLARCKASGELVAVKALNLEALGSPLEDIMREVRRFSVFLGGGGMSG